MNGEPDGREEQGVQELQAQSLKSSSRTDRMTVSVIGLGYIGLPTAAMFASCGVYVKGVDVNEHVVAVLNNGGVHILEPGLNKLVEVARETGNLEIACSLTEADVFIIAVHTPLGEAKRADLRFVVAATEAIVPRLRSGNLVILESTCPPGTTIGVVAPILERSGLRAGTDFHLCYSPERVLPGKILRELVENPRVMGGFDQISAEIAKDLYTTFVKGEILLADATTAEMVKLIENTFRDVNIALANEFARLADRLGINVWEAIELANRHPRVKILHPGPGVGGHCISVDPWFLVEAAPDLARLIRQARLVNDEQPRFVVSVLERELGRVQGRRVAVLGLAFKADVDDLRESPSIAIAKLLAEAGAIVTTYEPNRLNAEVDGCAAKVSVEDAMEGAEAVVLSVAHKEIRALSPRVVRKASNAKLVLDACGVCDRREWEAAGLHLVVLGDGRATGQLVRTLTEE